MIIIIDSPSINISKYIYNNIKCIPNLNLSEQWYNAILLTISSFNLFRLDDNLSILIEYNP